jgi:hypothetical protein
MFELNVMKNRRLKAEQAEAERVEAVQASAKYMLRTPELILEHLQTTYPDTLPTTVINSEYVARLQGRQDVIRLLSGLIKTANGDTP